MPANAARMLSAQALEDGSSGSGFEFDGSFGDGSGKWQLFVTAECPIQVMSLLLSDAGHLTNLSTSTVSSPSDMMAGDAFLNSVLERDFANNEVRISNTSGVTAIEENDAGGYDVTVVIDGCAPQTISFTASDKRVYDGWAEFTKPGVPLGIWDHTGTFFGNPGFSHFDAYGWQVDLDSTYRGSVVHGDPTEALPATGTATYTGRSRWRSYPTDDPSSSAMGRFRSQMELIVDFDNRSVDVRFHTWELRDPGETEYDDASSGTEVTTRNAEFTNTGFTADLVGVGDAAEFTGRITGQFFGPDAEEVGGTATGMNVVYGEVFQGWFGGAQ